METFSGVLCRTSLKRNMCENIKNVEIVKKS